MTTKKYFFITLISIAMLSGCGMRPYSVCKPVLFPYVEYEYKAESNTLSNTFTHNNEKIIEFHGVKLALPIGWVFEKQFNNKTVKFTKGKDNFFILNFKKNRLIQNDDIEDFNMIGCKAFGDKEKIFEKNSREFYRDLYFFTEDDLNEEPGFWQYYILWAKTKFLRDAIKLLHYTGENLEAFQRIIDPGSSCGKAGVVMQSEIFPQKMAPDYLKIASGFRDDVFFLEFIEMMNAMNP